MKRVNWDGTSMKEKQFVVTRKHEFENRGQSKRGTFEIFRTTRSRTIKTEKITF